MDRKNEIFLFLFYIFMFCDDAKIRSYDIIIFYRADNTRIRYQHQKYITTHPVSMRWYTFIVVSKCHAVKISEGRESEKSYTDENDLK